MTGRASVWIGLDIGTRGVRAAAYSRDGTAVAEASIDRPPRVTDAGRMTHDPETDWWGGSVAALSTISDAVGGWQVEGIGLAGLFPAVALVGTDGIATSEGILHGDRRALHEIGTVAATLDVRLSGDEVSPRLVWLRDHEPAAMQAARVALGPAGYVGGRLTGVDSIDPHSAVRWGFGLNNLTLFGLVLAIGIVVDDAIVVVEASSITSSAGWRRATRRAKPCRKWLAR